MPNLVPPDKLEQANQLSLFTTFGTAPVAGLLFSVLAVVSSHISPYFSTNQVNLALYFNVVTFVVSALTIFMLKELRGRPRSAISAPSMLKSIWEGWRFLRQTKVVRGIVIGMTGAFAAGGVVVGLGPSYIRSTLQGGSAGWGAVWAAIFIGLALGMFPGPRILYGFSLRRMFGLSIAFAAVPLALIAFIPSLIAVTRAHRAAWHVRRNCLRDRLHRHRPGGRRRHPRPDVRLPAVGDQGDPVRGDSDCADAGSRVRRTGRVSTVRVGDAVYRNIGYNLVLLLAAVVALLLGRVSYRQMDDRKGVPLWADLTSVFRGGRAGNARRQQRRDAVAAACPPCRRVHRARGRRGGRQVHPGQAAGDLASRPGLRRGHHA